MQSIDTTLTITLAILLMANFSMVKTSPTATAQTTMVYVDPQLTTIDEIGKTFEINMSISQVTDLAAWEFKLYYESSPLNAININ